MEKRFTLQQQLGMVLAVGFTAGTIFANFPGKPYVGEIGILSSSYRDYLLAGGWDLQKLFLTLLASRVVPALLMVVLSFTKWKLPALRLLCLWASFSLGVFWAACILTSGISGIFVFFMALFPHGLLLFWGWLTMTRVILGRNLTLSHLLPPFSFLLLGVIAETWIHPYLLRFLFRLVFP
ncbi:hypothetical protein MUB23_11015 [Cuneatibacter sp. NSJ-177]|uniref:hypothetical protein n=1 Tax=Cuneatibacter sp. NSJ-177 TaxID=2931401 RepID=UPI001FD26EF3|nr:hypothetical protein [Cuneatibacter sp. NSJ-177]MCJ7835915.1 hypothetical protein [Cuneatibacter sp. NSJ-177]